MKYKKQKYINPNKKHTLKVYFIIFIILSIISIAVMFFATYLNANKYINSNSEMVITLFAFAVLMITFTLIVLIGNRMENNKSYEMMIAYNNNQIRTNNLVILFNAYIYDKIDAELLKYNLDMFYYSSFFIEPSFAFYSKKSTNDKQLILKFYEHSIEYFYGSANIYEFEIEDDQWNKIDCINYRSLSKIISVLNEVYCNEIEKSKHILNIFNNIKYN